MHPVRDTRFARSPPAYCPLDLSDLTDLDSEDELVGRQEEDADGLDWADGAPGLAEAIAEELDNLYVVYPIMH